MADLLLRELREDRQRHGLVGRGLRLREVAGLVAEGGEALLQVKRDRVVDLGADAALGQVLTQRVAKLANDEPEQLARIVRGWIAEERR